MRIITSRGPGVIRTEQAVRVYGHMPPGEPIQWPRTGLHYPAYAQDVEAVLVRVVTPRRTGPWCIATITVTGGNRRDRADPTSPITDRTVATVYGAHDPDDPNVLPVSATAVEQAAVRAARARHVPRLGGPAADIDAFRAAPVWAVAWAADAAASLDARGIDAAAARPPLVPAGPNPDMDAAWLADLAEFARLSAASAAATDLADSDDLADEAEGYAVAVARGLAERAAAGDITLPPTGA